MICRGCGADATRVFCDLGSQPPANLLLTAAQLTDPRVSYPLTPVICERCQLVQLPQAVAPGEIFGEYPYFSSQSGAFVAHAGKYAAAMIDRFNLDSSSLVVEVASNDGYLLRHFVSAGVRCYGVEPARNVALAAIRSGVPTLSEFFDATLVREQLIDSDGAFITGGRADLIAANNVLAHVPDLQAFIQGLRMLLAPEGVLTIEVPWLHDLIEEDEVGTIYHEHLSYFLLSSLEHALGLTAAPLRVFDVEHLHVHGGSLRVFCCHQDAGHAERPSVAALRFSERAWLATDPLSGFSARPAALKRRLWEFLLSQHRHGHRVAGYGAAAKAATVLSYCAIGPELVPYIADTTPAKQGRYLAGSRIPIVTPEHLLADEPDVIWILPFNWAQQIRTRLLEQCAWGPTLMWQQGARIACWQGASDREHPAAHRQAA